MKPILNILIGLPGSGKTTYARKHLTNSVYLSSDDIRIELFGYECQTNNDLVFRTMHKRCKENLNKGLNVTFDATNISRKKRLALINELKHIDVQIDAYMFCAPICDILETNIIRSERHLPYEKLILFLKNLEVPMYYEGFENIYLINCIKDGFKHNIYDKDWFANKAKDYNQENPYHKETLDEHVNLMLEEMDRGNNHNTLQMKTDDRYIKLKNAIIFHDFGKLYTKEYNEKKGYCTYYNHENISAYLWLCHLALTTPFDEKYRYRLGKFFYETSVLIAHHMDFYKKDIEKTKKIINDDNLFELLEVFHEIDKKGSVSI